MTAALALALIGTFNKLVDLFVLLVSKADDTTTAKLIGIWVEREAWWQENMWRPLGEWIAKLDD